MQAACNVCGAPLREPVYESADNASITTMNKVIEGRTRVYFCNDCGHLQTSELPNLVQYYAQEYEINLASDEEDQLYKVIDGRAIYRAEHQADTLLRKLSLLVRPEGPRLRLRQSADAAQGSGSRARRDPDGLRR